MTHHPAASALPRAAELRRALRRQASPRDARHLQRFFKTGPGDYGEGDRFLGLRVPALRAFARAFADLPHRDTVRLLRSPWHEERLLALLIMVRQYQRGDGADRKRIYRTYVTNTSYINNWDLVDLSAEHIVGAHLPPGKRQVLDQLARSPDLWERRIAMLSTFHYIKHRDFADALRIARRLLHDDHDLIHKAVGWMLREIGNRDRAVEERFLQNHYRGMPRTMLRYAIEKFPEAKREAYLDGRVRQS
jgi:3-methyladenine DNA glycosylase AlkD